jgi:hypothetical protein
MTATLRYAGQAVVLLLFMAIIGTFADSPAYVHHPPGLALIKLSFSHGAERKGECRRLSAEEIARLAPNMRRPTQCPRERLPVHVELALDGNLVYRGTLPPAGLSGDGPSRVYERFPVAPGAHRIAVRLRDTARAEGFDHERTEIVELKPGQNFVVDFRSDAGGFIFR